MRYLPLRSKRCLIDYWRRIPSRFGPKIIVEGETGFIVDDIDRAVEAVGKIDQISRARCRRGREVHRSSHGRGLHPDLPAIAQPFIYSSRSLEWLPGIAPKRDPIERSLAGQVDLTKGSKQ